MGNITPLVIQWLEQVLRENNPPPLIEIVISPSLVLFILVAYTFLAILLHNVCFILKVYTFLYIKWCCQEKSTGKTTKIESQNICVRASGTSERTLEFLIVLQFKNVLFFTINVTF